MKKIIFALFFLCVLAAGTFAQQYDPESDFTVAVISNGSAVRITGYVGKNTVVRIPPRIRNLPVTEIGERAFREKGLTSVTIPSGVILIGDLAFLSNRLVGVTIPNTVTSIKPAAFANNSLTSVVISNSVREISAEAFGANNISEITIGANVRIGEDAFGNGFEEFYSANGRIAKTYKRNGGYWCDFYENGFAAIATNNGRSAQIVGYSGTNTNFQIPSQINNLPVTAIGESAFARKRLTGVVIPNSVTSIGANAFYGNGLATITIGPNITLGDLAFGNFTDLYTATGRKAGTYTFNKDNNYWYEFIENNYAGVISSNRSVIITAYSGTGGALQIPSQLRNMPVTRIWDFVFQNKGITSATIPNSIISIGESAFTRNSLSSVIILSSQITIHGTAFDHNSNIKFIDFRRLEGPNPKQAALELGSAVFREIQILRILGDTEAVSRHEAVLQLITGRGSATRTEIEKFYRDNIHGQIPPIADFRTGLEKGYDPNGFKVDKSSNLDMWFCGTMYMEIVINRFLGNTAVVTKYENWLKTVCDKNNVTRAEVEQFYRNNVRALIAAVADEEFNKVSFMLDRHNATLKRNPQNGQFVLSYRGVNTNNETRAVTGNSVDALVSEMRNGTNKADFTSADLNTVRAQAVLIPAVVYDNYKASGRGDGLSVLKEALTNFYIQPTNANYNVILGIYAKNRVLELSNAGSSAFPRNVIDALVTVLSNLNSGLAEKVTNNMQRVNIRETANALTGERYQVFSIPYTPR